MTQAKDLIPGQTVEVDGKDHTVKSVVDGNVPNVVHLVTISPKGAEVVFYVYRDQNIKVKENA